MARIRTIKPEFFTSADICGLTPLARLLYIALWCEADREGRFVWNPRTFKIRYLPEDRCDIGELCQTLVDAGLVILYTIDGEQFAVIPTFATHQQVNNRESESKLPVPDVPLTRQARVIDASCTRDSRDTDAAKTPLLRKGKERKGSLTTIDESFSVPDDWIAEATAKQPGVDWRREALRFASHHVAKGSTFRDWKAAWRTWTNSPYEKSKPSARAADDGLPDFMVGMI